MEFFNAEGYKIEITKDSSSVFKVSTMDGQVLEDVQSIAGLVEAKYLPASRVTDLKQQLDRTFSSELNALQGLYYSHIDSEQFFSRYFEGITFVYKIAKNYSKEVQKKITDEVSNIVKTDSKTFPVYMEDNKLKVIFLVNPYDYLKSFKTLYDKIIRDGNYSVINQATELIIALDKIYSTTLKIMEIADKYQ